MMLNKKEKKSHEKEELRRFYHRNIDAMRWCNKNGVTIYAAAQASNSSMIKLFKQRGEKFVALSEKLYNQENRLDVVSYTAAIDAEYERIYNLKKDELR